ncbi:Shikimate kinase [Candidatus Nitrosocaldus cavascurensis]|uniref:Shikimate kinase n=2 Tax=Candidatus Nitrosocaldaceae TaxID=1968910 RepID=A0A2K5APL9_9ARCH|nr:Shikimate kinase [Candidatus Nitrosocaldus cavascurensis]
MVIGMDRDTNSNTRIAMVNMHGAISIVNAIPTGKGSTLGIGLGVNVTVRMSSGQGRIVSNTGDVGFIHNIIKRIMPDDMLKHKDIAIEIRSRIPMGYGLKSSSAVSNAIALACHRLVVNDDNYGDEDNHDDARDWITARDLKVIDAAVSASIESRVSITGAFDDACACYFGGIFVTDNHARRILKHERVDENVNVVILLPMGIRRSDPMRLRHPLLVEHFNHAVRLAEDGRYWDAMILNGVLVSSLLSIPYNLVLDALEHGALAAGISGNGPAVTAITDSESKAKDIAYVWQNYGEVIRSKASNEKAVVSMVEG